MRRRYPLARLVWKENADERVAPPTASLGCG